MKKLLFFIFLFSNVSAKLTAQVTTSANNDVGIGTTTPGSKLHVYSSASANDLTIENTVATGQSSLVVRPGSGTNWTFGATGGSHALFPNSFFVYNVNGTNPGGKFVINTSGKVGIGNAAPIDFLDINSSILRAVNLSETSDFNSTTKSFINFGINSRGANAETVANAGALYGIKLTAQKSFPTSNTLESKAVIYGLVSEDVSKGYARKVGAAIYTSDLDQTAVERMRITGNGDVVIGNAFSRGKLGIGITPTSAFHLATTGKWGDDAWIQIQRRDTNAAHMGLILLPSGTRSNNNKAWGYGVWGSTNDLRIWNHNGSTNQFILTASGTNGNVGIGTTLPQQKLQVEGNIHATGKVFIGTYPLSGTTFDYSKANTYALAVKGTAIVEKMIVQLYPSWPDYVFKSTYKLRSLNSLETFITKHSHLPDVPSAAQVEKGGLDIGATQAALLRKIEELTLYVIQLNKKIDKLERDR